jgi:glutathione peroxidase
MIRTNRYTLAALAALALLLDSPEPSRAAPNEARTGAASTLLGFEAKRLGGDTEALARYRGEVLLVVNTASRCGHTPQYEGLQALYDRFREQGFSVLGFPSNDFGNQEPGSDREIGAFCKANYGVDFPMFSKVHVSGDGAHPVYAYLTSLPAPLGGPVKWNFQKYLVDRQGLVVARYESGVRPQDAGLVAELERLLAAPRPEESAKDAAP